MDEPSLILVCLAAFTAVLVILSFLAGVIRLLTWAFPHVEAEQDHGDAALLAAISAAVARAYPDTRVTKIEERR